MVRPSSCHRGIVERTRTRRSYCRRHVIGDFAWLRRLAYVEHPDSRFEISARQRRGICRVIDTAVMAAIGKARQPHQVGKDRVAVFWIVHLELQLADDLGM